MSHYRAGSHNARNIYRAGTSRATDEHIGVMFAPEVARLVVDVLNNHDYKPRYRLQRIAEAHTKHVGHGGLTTGLCTECERDWPCPTYNWTQNEHDPIVDPWEPSAALDDYSDQDDTS